jgi:hypothetical protein
MAAPRVKEGGGWIERCVGAAFSQAAARASGEPLIRLPWNPLACNQARRWQAWPFGSERAATASRLSGDDLDQTGLIRLLYRQMCRQSRRALALAPDALRTATQRNSQLKN